MDTGLDDALISRRLDIGRLECINHNIEALVIADGWPSWTLAIQGLSFDNIVTKLVNTCVSVREEIIHTSIGPSVSNIPVQQWLVSKVNQIKVIFVQTSHATFQATINECEQIMFEKVIFVCRDQDYYSADCFRISHVETGGITRGSWSYHINNLPRPKLETSNVRRTIGHVLDVTQGASKLKVDSRHDIIRSTE